MEERILSALWLGALLGPGSDRAGEIRDRFGSPEAAFRQRFSQEFLELLTKGQLDRLPALTLEDQKPTLVLCQRLGVTVLTWEDPDYPASFLELEDLPAALFVTGNPTILNHPCCVGMIGSRRPSAYGVRVCAEIGGQLARAGAVLVSGLADGLDSQTHRAAVEAEMPTIGILGTPIDKTYPATNGTLRRQMEELGGAVISEYPPHRESHKQYFLLRNRLIAALSRVLCVVEARAKSGTMSTVNRARKYGRPVYAVPGNVFSPLSEGTNQLIAQGSARVLRSGESLLAELGLGEPTEGLVTPGPVASLSATAKQLLGVLGDRPVGLEAICQVSGLGTGPVLAALTELELSGQIQALPGRQYRLS